MIIIGPSLISGIGQHAQKYIKLFSPDCTYYTFGNEIPEHEHGLIFMLPIKDHIEYVKYAKTRVKNLACMTVCETETVHEDYELIMKEFKRVAVPSEFCKKVLSRQFPDNEFFVIHAHIPNPRERPYTFYHIGKSLKIPVENTLTLDKPINLETNDILRVVAEVNADSSAPDVEVYASILEIS